MNYRAIILDMDGTLYYQFPVRLTMFFYLIFYYIIRPTRIKELFLLNQYRIIREEGLFSEFPDFDNRQIYFLSEKYNIPFSRVQNLISFWMTDNCLKVIARYKDKLLLKQIKKFEDAGGIVIVYSDYPMKRKMKAIGLQAHFQFFSGDENLKCMKPSKENMETILAITELMPCDVLFIGDRYDKDAKSAETVGMDSLVLSKFAFRRKKQRSLIQYGDDNQLNKNYSSE